MFADLDRGVRARLRTLSKDNANAVGLHLVMAGRLLDIDPELAYEHAQAAVRGGGRVDVVREAAGLAAYRTGRFAEALRELRTVRRLNGSSEHLAVMADCERGLGRPERAIALAASPEAENLDAETRTELAMVVSGARLDMGDPDAALAVLSGVETGPVRGLLAARVAQAKAEALRAGGREAEAEAAVADFPAALLAEAAGEDVEEEDDVVVFDLDEDEDSDGSADESDAASDGDLDDDVDADGAEVDDATDASGGEAADDLADVADVADVEVGQGTAPAVTEPVADESVDDGSDDEVVAAVDAGATADAGSEPEPETAPTADGTTTTTEDE
ncbi:MAG TPA: hypothetical protein VGC57_11055 [Cellulomonas sp.]